MKSLIKLLPEHIIDQIKAGEVIERPASLIKEIIENSLDAHATKIDLHIVNGGLDLISIIDNGDGMDFASLPLAFCRHATSKIEQFEDLYHLHSFGFRGEALASISAIARVTCVSSPKDSQYSGGKIIIQGAQTLAHVEQKQNDHGTSLFIKDLFFNTPVRLKFAKSQTSEKNAIKRVIESFILANPHVAFSVKWDEQEKNIYPALDKEQYEKRIHQLYPKKFSSHELIHFQSDYDDHLVEGFFTTQTANSPSRLQFLFSNHRFFQDKSIHQAIVRAVEKNFFGESLGHYFVFISSPPEEIDVNVHPNKTQIKFAKMEVINSLIYNGIKNSIKEISQREENQANSLHHAEQSTQFQFAPRSFSDVLSHYSENALMDHSKSIIDVTYQSHQAQHSGQLILNQYVIIDQKNLLSLPRLMAYHHASLFLKHYPIEEHYITPLLISEPMLLSPKDELLVGDHFKKLGLDFDRLSESTCVLRTIPYFLEQQSLKQVITALSKYFIQHKKIEFHSLYTQLFDCFNHVTYSELTNWQKIFGQYALSELFEHHIYIQLNAKILEDLFQ